MHSRRGTSILYSCGIQEHHFIFFCSLFWEYSRIKAHYFENNVVVMKCLCLSLCSSNSVLSEITVVFSNTEGGKEM